MKQKNGLCCFRIAFTQAFDLEFVRFLPDRFCLTNMILAISMAFLFLVAGLPPTVAMAHTSAATIRKACSRRTYQ